LGDARKFAVIIQLPRAQYNTIKFLCLPKQLDINAGDSGITVT